VSRSAYSRQARGPVPPVTATTSRSTSTFDAYQLQRIARAGLHGGIDDAFETAGSIAGSPLGPLGAVGGGLLGRGLGSLLGFSAHRGGTATAAGRQRGESPAQPVYVVMPGLSELLSELVSLTRAAQLRSAGIGLDALTHDVAVSNARAGVLS
jgi:hypothetical protein